IYHVTKAHVIQVECIGDVVIQANVVVVNRVFPNGAKTKSHCLPVLPPGEIAKPPRHSASGFEKIVACKDFETDRASVRYIQIQWIDFVNNLCAIFRYFERERWHSPA